MADVNKKQIWRYPWDLLMTYLKAVLQDIYRFLERLSEPEQRKEIWKSIKTSLRYFFGYFKKEKIFREAGSLTYITILGFIPFIVFILMLAPDLPFLNLREKILLLISDNFMPTSAMAISGVIEGVLSRKAGFNIFSFIILLISSYSLFRVIRDTFDRILSVDDYVKPGMLSQIVRFLGTIILGGLIMVLLFSSSSLPLVSRIMKLPMLNWLTYVLPFVMQFLGMVALYLLMPSNKIKMASLVRGAFWTTVIWVLAKSVFDFYIYRLTNIQVMYGVLAALPIFLMWIYVNWVIILSGIIMVSAIENKDDLTLDFPEAPKKIKVTMEIITNNKLIRALDKKFSLKDLKILLSELEDNHDE